MILGFVSATPNSWKYLWKSNWYNYRRSQSGLLRMISIRSWPRCEHRHPLSSPIFVLADCAKRLRLGSISWLSTTHKSYQASSTLNHHFSCSQHTTIMTWKAQSNLGVTSHVHNWEECNTTEAWLLNNVFRTRIPALLLLLPNVYLIRSWGNIC